MVFVSFDVYSYSCGGRDFSKHNAVECPNSLPPATLSLSFSRLQKLLNGISWTTSTLQLKISEGVLISNEASSPEPSQTLSHLSLKIPWEVGSGQRKGSQKGKGALRQGHWWRFCSEAQQSSSGVELASCGIHSPSIHELTPETWRVLIKQMQNKIPGMKEKARLTGN